MKIGTKSLLFGAHQFALHPWFVAAAWTRLYGFPWDPRLWVAFFIHDLGYWGKPNMDGPEGETHVEFGAWLMGKLFDWRNPKCPRCAGVGQHWEHYGEFSDFDAVECDLCNKWKQFSRYHSRFYAKRDRMPYSRLCVADKYAVALTPAWLYLPCARLTGEIHEYKQLARDRTDKGEPSFRGKAKYSTMNVYSADDAQWYANIQEYLRRWAFEHRDLKPDGWTPDPFAEEGAA